jgi:hypothetical protein
MVVKKISISEPAGDFRSLFILAIKRQEQDKRIRGRKYGFQCPGVGLLMRKIVQCASKQNAA